MPIVRKGVFRRVQFVEPSGDSGDPKHAGPISVNRSDEVFAQAVWVTRSGPVGLQTVPVMPEQTVDSAEPQEPILILHDAPRERLKWDIVCGNVCEADVLLVNDWQGHDTAVTRRCGCFAGLCAGAGCHDAEEQERPQDGSDDSSFSG